MLVEITERAMAHCGSQEALIVGGVGCMYHWTGLLFCILGHVLLAPDTLNLLRVWGNYLFCFCPVLPSPCTYFIFLSQCT